MSRHEPSFECKGIYVSVLGKIGDNEYNRGGGNMRKSIAAVALVAIVALGLLYTGAITLAHAYVHVSKTVMTKHGVYPKSVTHTKHGTVIHTGSMSY